MEKRFPTSDWRRNACGFGLFGRGFGLSEVGNLLSMRGLAGGWKL